MKVRPKKDYRGLYQSEEHKVHAIAIWNSGKIKFCIIRGRTGDRSGIMTWSSASMFIVTDPSIPPDWECHLFVHSFVQMLIGPSYISESPESYIKLAEHEHDQIQEFWERDKRSDEPSIE